ncbi:MAG: MFS transporter [Ruminococcaceae bacterium]|nr:MFS transporter [Oscillospiraceae bacterium]
MSTKIKNPMEQKHVKNVEFVFYLAAIFFYTMMTGIVGSYRQAYLVNILKLSDDSVSFYNAFLSIAGFVMSFVYAMIIDNRKIGKKGKFIPIVNAVAIPIGIVTMLLFYTPKGLSGTILMIYLITIGMLHGACTSFGNAINLVSYVVSPNNKERDKVISFRSISSAVGNSAPLVVVLVIGLIIDKVSPDNPNKEYMEYIIGASLISVIGTIITLMGMRFLKERITYTEEKKNPFKGFVDIIKNKYAWTIIISETLKNLRGIANYMGPFLAAALLGGTDKFLLFGLPTGIGTAVGMLVINFLLKKFTAKVLYIASGIYSVTVNVIAFAVGYMYFTTGAGALQIIFIACLFLIGLQFGASNLLPSMFQADVLESIELQTKGKRLDAALPTVIGIGTMVTGTIAQSLSPQILYGEGSIIGYIQPTDDVPNPTQSLETKIMMLFFYTIFHGIMMFLAGVPFFFYKLTGKRKEEVHNAVLAQREELAQ